MVLKQLSFHMGRNKFIFDTLLDMNPCIGKQGYTYSEVTNTITYNFRHEHDTEKNEICLTDAQALEIVKNNIIKEGTNYIRYWSNMIDNIQTIYEEKMKGLENGR